MHLRGQLRTFGGDSNMVMRAILFFKSISNASSAQCPCGVMDEKEDVVSTIFMKNLMEM